MNPNTSSTGDKPSTDDTMPASTETVRERAVRAPDFIGPYKILETLGEGGMGTVYLAEQSKPIRRRVALKIIKLGMDTKQVIARFEAERQALALMNHPNVAKVFDAGATQDGRPFFVMEHVAGISITDYCDRHRLSTIERLKIFTDVCHAVQHAHQKGIIHRDIKPSNVLVAVEEGKPVPRVIDFGVAKATEQRLTERTVFTEQGQLIGTPEYMSPEQAEMTALDIDTRTDIYSLGVMLYQLLAGALPFDPAQLRRAGFAEIQRLIREQEPPKPSTRLSTLNETSTTVAEQRHTDPKSLARQLQGDLDWITMKAMDKDRTRRYATPSAFADDIERHLKHVPVLAGPPTATYWVKKFVRRNRGLVTAIAVVFLVLAAGLVGTTLQYLSAEKARTAEQMQRRIAEAAEQEQSRAREEAEQARSEAERQASIAKAVNEFLNYDLLAAVNPWNEPNPELTVREVLDTASMAIVDRFENEALVEASVRLTLGSTYHGLGEYEQAKPHLERALKLLENEAGEKDEDTVAAMNMVGMLYVEQGRYEEAESLLKHSLELHRRHFGKEYLDRAAYLDNLALAYIRQNRYDEAEPLDVEALELRRQVLGEDHPETLMSMNKLAMIRESQGRYEEAETLYLQTIAMQRRAFGDNHPDTLTYMHNLSGLYTEQGRFDEAHSLCAQVLESRRRVLGEEHPHTLLSMHIMAFLYDQRGHASEAEALCARVYELRRRVLGEEHRDTLDSLISLATQKVNLGKHEEAEPMLRKLVDLQRSVLRNKDTSLLRSMNNLALVYWKQDRYEEAEALYERTLEQWRILRGENHVDVAMVVGNLGVLLRDKGELDRSAALLRQAIGKFGEMLGDDYWLTGNFRSHLGECLTKMAQYVEAERELFEAHRILWAALGDEHARTTLAVKRLVTLYEAWHTAEPGKGYDTKAAEWRAKLRSTPQPSDVPE